LRYGGRKKGSEAVPFERLEDVFIEQIGRNHSLLLFNANGVRKALETAKVSRNKKTIKVLLENMKRQGTAMLVPDILLILRRKVRRRKRQRKDRRIRDAYALTFHGFVLLLAKLKDPEYIKSAILSYNDIGLGQVFPFFAQEKGELSREQKGKVREWMIAPLPKDIDRAPLPIEGLKPTAPVLKMERAIGPNVYRSFAEAARLTANNSALLPKAADRDWKDTFGLNFIEIYPWLSRKKIQRIVSNPEISRFIKYLLRDEEARLKAKRTAIRSEEQALQELRATIFGRALRSGAT
jgi:hypothetical protein